MRLALIPPIELLEYTDETDLQLMLPQLLSNDVYRYVYQRHCDDPHQYVILDNGIAEGVETQAGQLIKTAHQFGVDEIVIPDIMLDARGTLNEYEKFWDYARESESLKGLKTMFVLQGRNEDELFTMADHACNPRFRAHVIGIPRHTLVTCNNERIRRSLSRYIHSRNKTKQIHLLGASPEFPSELKHFRGTRYVRSTDTSSAFNYAFQGELLAQKYAPIRRPPGYFDLHWTQFHMDKLDKNVKKLRCWTEQA